MIGLSRSRRAALSFPLLACGLVLSASGAAESQEAFLRGDVNIDGRVSTSDALFGYLFLDGSRPACPDAADANDDGRADIVDPVSILTSLFLDGSALPPLSSSRGIDPTDDDLDC